MGQNGGNIMVTKHNLPPESIEKQEVTIKLMKVENKMSQERTDIRPEDNKLNGHIGDSWLKRRHSTGGCVN